MDTALFTKYPSIENVKAGLVRKFTADTGDALCPWVALEKIHGANFGFVCSAADAHQVRLQRRNALLEEGEKFYGVTGSVLVRDLQKCVRALFDLAGASESVVVFGELFGSNVQSEIFYSAHLQFACFDICADGVLLSYDKVIGLCGVTGIPVVRPLRAPAPLATLLDHYSDLEALASVYNANAIAEGIILRPVAEAYALSSGRPRPILKKKRALFAERKPAGTAANDDDAIGTACAFVTPGRLASVRSKMLQDAPFFETAKALAADVLSEIEVNAAAGDDEYAFWALASDALKKRISKSVTNAAFALVKGNGKSFILRAVPQMLCPPGVVTNISHATSQAFQTDTNLDGYVLAYEEFKTSLLFGTANEKDKGATQEINQPNSRMTSFFSESMRQFDTHL
jgi:Rnl2 family RNA ligase